MHVTLRAVPGLPSFRTAETVSLVLLQMRRLNDASFQIVHFSVQTNHLHFIVEATDRETVSRKMRGFGISFASRLNRHLLGRRGEKVWSDRFYRRDIADAREMHNVLAYVFGNAKKHGVLPRDAWALDPYSSAWTFDGFGVDVAPPPERVRWRAPTPRTDLLAREWVIHGCVPF